MTIQLQPQSTNLESWIRTAREECAFFEVMDPFFMPGYDDFQKVSHIAEQFQKTGIVSSLHGAFIDVNPNSGDPRLRELSRQRCRESCALAVFLGAQNVIFHSSAFPFLRGAYLQNWAEGCASFYEELASLYPVNIYIENAQDLDPTPLRMLMDNISSDRIGVCLDVGHANYSRVPVEQWFDVLAERVGYLHLSDNTGAFDDHLPLGQGSVDWKMVDRCWQQLGKDMPITLETVTLDATKESIRFLQKHGYFGWKGNQYGQ